MENIYKVVKIEDKGFGCVALQDIKIGTLILIDHAKCVAQQELKTEGLFYEYFESQIESFLSMSQNDQEEFLKLHNRFEDSNTFSNDDEADYFLKLKQFSEIYSFYNDPGLLEEFDENLALIVLGIYATNSFPEGVGIKISRFNHSCRPNAEVIWFQEDEVEVRAVSKIKTGQEITIPYNKKMVMKNYKTRQEFYSGLGGFKCCCELCQEEAINCDDEIYEVFQRLENEVEKAMLEKPAQLLEKKYENYEKMISCLKQMYKIAKDKRAPKLFIVELLNKGCMAGVQGYLSAKMIHDFGKMEYFREEIQKLARVAEHIAILTLGRESPTAREWKERNKNFEKWFTE